MTTQFPTNAFDPLDGIIAEYLQAIEAGKAPSREAWLAQHPEHAERLRAFLRDWDAVGQDASKFKLPASIGDGETVGFVSTTSLPTLRYLGDYELVSEIARGGMGVVYRARQVSLNRTVAIKMILAGTYATAQAVQRFRAEAEAAANLDHPNILPIYEVGEYEGHQYFSMKLVEGGSLSGKIDELKSQPKQVASLMATLARAVHFAHQRGILHRDLKPANVLLDQDGTPFITDFGLAKKVNEDDGSTRTGSIVGTPSYMAPEQARGEKGLTTSVDIYSLGAILYEMLTGKPPFKGETVYATVKQVLEQEPTKPDGDRDLGVIALKCLSKDLAKRYASAGELAEDLERWTRGEAIQARPVGRVEKICKWVRRNKLLAAAEAVMVFAVIAFVGMQIYYNRILAISLNASTQAKILAEQNAEEAKAERQRADKNAKESQGRLVRQYLSNGNRLLETDDMAGAMAWYTEALALEDSPELALVHRRRIGCMLREHPQLVANWLLPESLINADYVLFSFDGRTVVATINDEAHVYEVLTGKSLYPPLKLSSGVGIASFSEGDKFILTGKTIEPTDKAKPAQAMYRLWHKATGQPASPEFKVNGRLSNEWPLIDPEGKWVTLPLATDAPESQALDPVRIVLWEIATNKTKPIELPPGFYIHSFTPDHKHALAILASQQGDDRPGQDQNYPDAQLQLLDTKTWKLIGPKLIVKRPTNRPYVSVFFAGDDTLIVGDEDRNEVGFYHLNGEKFKAIPLTGLQGVVRLAGNQVCLMGADQMHIATVKVPRILRSFRIDQPFTDAIGSPDGNRIAVWDRNKTDVTIYDVQGHRLTPKLQLRKQITRPVFSEDGTQFTYLDGDRLVRSFSFVQPVVQRQMDNNFFHGQRYVQTIGNIHSLIDAEGLRLVRAFNTAGQNLDDELSPTGRYLFRLDNKGVLFLHDLEQDIKKTIATKFTKKPEKTQLCRWWSDHTLVLQESQPEKMVFQQLDARTGELGPLIEGPPQPQAASSTFSSWAPEVTVAGWYDSKEVNHFKLLATGEDWLPPFRSIPGYPEDSAAWVLDYGKKSIIMRTSRDSGRYVVWDKENSFRTIKSEVTITSAGALINADETRAVLYDVSDFVLVDLINAKVIAKSAMPGDINHVEMHDATGTLVINSRKRNYDGRADEATIRIFDLATGRPRTGYLKVGDAKAMALSPDGRMIHAGRRLLDTTTGSPLNSEYGQLAEGRSVCFTKDNICVRLDVNYPGYRSELYGVELIDNQPYGILQVQSIAPDQRSLAELRRYLVALSCRAFDQTESLSLASGEEITKGWQPMPGAIPTPKEKRFWYQHQFDQVRGNKEYLRFLLNQLVELEPQEQKWPLYLGQQCRAEGKLSEAMKNYNVAITRMSKSGTLDFEPVRARAAAYYEQRDWKKADDDYTFCLSQNAKDENAKISRGVVRMRQERWLEAIPDLEPIRKRDIFTERFIAFAYAFAGKQKEFQQECETYLKPVIARQNTNYASDEERAAIYMVLLDPGPSPHLAKAAEWFEKHHYQEYPTEFDKILKGIIAYRQGKYAESVKILKSLQNDKVEQKLPFESLPFLVMAYHRLGKPELVKIHQEMLVKALQEQDRELNPFHYFNLKLLSREVEVVLSKPIPAK